MGGDSAGVAGLGLHIRSDEKVFFNGDFLIGFTSSFRMGQLLRFKFEPPKQNKNQEDYQYMVTDFIDAVRQCFSDNGMEKSRDGIVTGGTYLVGYKEELYYVYEDYQVGLLADKFGAVGCGDDIALGSLYSTALINIAPEQRIQVALEAAERFSAGVRGPFTILKLEA
jgi:hypothetical protein